MAIPKLSMVICLVKLYATVINAYDKSELQQNMA